MLVFSMIVFQALIFIILIFTFRKIMSQNMVSATKHLDILNEDFNKKEEETNKILAESKKKAGDIVSNARKEAEELKEGLLKDAQSEQDKLLNEARKKSEEIIEQADKSRNLLISEIEKRIEDEAVLKSCELTAGILPDRFKEDFHKESISELVKNGFQQSNRLHIPEDIKDVKIVSAIKLDDKIKASLSEAVNIFLGREVSIKEEVDGSIGAGIIINIGSLVLDGSLLNRIREESKTLRPNKEIISE
ncbi:F0F1 ATP synthase subunit delta [Candidatus Omnitrophota bacterium]